MAGFPGDTTDKLFHGISNRLRLDEPTDLTHWLKHCFRLRREKREDLRAKCESLMQPRWAVVDHGQACRRGENVLKRLVSRSTAELMSTYHPLQLFAKYNSQSRRRLEPRREMKRAAVELCKRVGVEFVIVYAEAREGYV